MIKRIISGILAIIIALQPIPQTVYGMESSKVTVNSLMDETQKTESDALTEEEKKENSQESVEVLSEQNLELEEAQNVEERKEVLEEGEDVSSDINIVPDSSKEITDTISSNMTEEDMVESMETELTVFSNIHVEEIGYQYARIVMDIEFDRETWYDIDALYGGVICSESSLTTTGVRGQRLYIYKDENGNEVENRFYTDVKVHSEKAYTYTPYVHIEDELHNPLKIVAGESIEITGKRWEDLNPVLRLDSVSTTKAAWMLDLTDYNYSLDGYLSSSVYYREKGSDSWKNSSGSLDSESRLLMLGGLKETTDYEIYIELSNRNETDKKVSSAICSFTTQEDKVYSSEDFPDPVFYEYILGRCGGEQITQEELDQIRGVSIDEDTIKDNIPIKSIEGIQYLKYLEGIDIQYQDIVDVSMISELKYLKSIGFTSNELTSLPDMSKMMSLTVIHFDYNKIPNSEIVDSKLPENSSLLKAGNWTKMAEHQLDNIIKVKAPEVCYGWGNSQPIVLGISNLKYLDYTLEVNVAGTTFKTEITGGGSGSDYKIKGYAIPDTGLLPGTYEEVNVTIYDCYDREVAESIVDITLVEDTTTIAVNELNVGTTSFMVTGDLVGSNQNLTAIKLKKDGEMYGETNEWCTSSTISGDNRYEDFLYGKRYTYAIGGFEGERNARRYSQIIYVRKDLVPGSYDLEFTLEDGSTITEANAVCIDETPRVYSINNANTSEHRKIYYDGGDYIYVTISGYNLDTEKVWPEIYIDDTVLTSYDGLEAEEEYNATGMKYYIYRLKKLKKDNYWLKSRNFRWRLCTAEGYECQDLAWEHGFSYTYNKGMELELFWVDDYVTENSCKIYIKSQLPDNTEVKVTAYKAPNYSEFKAKGTGILNNGILTLDLYDKNGEIYYPHVGSNADCFLLEFFVGEEILQLKSQPTIYSCSGRFDSGTRPSLVVHDWDIIVYNDSTTETVHGIQWGNKTQPSYGVNFYLPNTNEKKLSMDLSESKVGDNKFYLFTKADIKDLDSTQVYRIEVTDKSGVRVLKRFYGYVTSKVEDSTPEVQPNKITLNKTNVTLNLEQEYQLTATISPSDATDKSVTWSSNNTDVVSVDNNGLVKAVGYGTAEITAATTNGKKAVCTVTVFDVKGEDILLKLGETSQIKIPEGINTKGIKYKSNNTAVATVNAKGLISAVGIGNAKITLQSGDLEIVYSVKVTNPLHSISLEENEILLQIGEFATNKVIFDPVYTDSDKTLTVVVEKEEIASVSVAGGKTIKITGLSAGTTDIKVTCGELEAVCKITVEKTVQLPDIDKHNVYALTNYHETLADISSQLLPGFEFQNPEIVLAKFAGENEKEFSVIYTDERGRKSPAVQKVKLLTISGITASINMSSVESGSDKKAVLNTDCLWTGFKAEEEIKEEFLQKYEFEVTANKEGIVSIEKNGEDFNLKGITPGKVKLTVLLREKGATGKNGILYEEKTDFVVVEKAAEISLEVLGASYNAEEDYYYVNDMEATSVSVKATARDYKLTWSSSDNGIAKVEKPVENTSKVVLKNNGKVKLTVTANDAGKTSKSIWLYVMDTKPSVDTSMTINKAHENGGTIGIYASYGYDIQQYDVQLMQKENQNKRDERFAIDYNLQKDVYEVIIADSDKVTKGKYSVVVKVTAKTETGTQDYYSDLEITVTDKPVTYSVKQKKKVNVFFTDGEGNGTLDIFSKNAEIENVELSDCDFVYNMTDGSLSFVGSNYKNIDKEGILRIKFKDYSEVSQKITIQTETKKPAAAMSAASSVLYPNVGITKAQIEIKNKTTGESYFIKNTHLNQPDNISDAYDVYAEEGNIYIKLKEKIAEYPKNAKITFTVQMDNWNEEIAFTHTVKANFSNNPTLTLSSSKITLNKNVNVARYQEADVAVKLKNATDSGAIDDVLISGADTKALSVMKKGVDFAFEMETGRLKASFNNSNLVSKGTYNYIVHTQIAEDKSITAKLKVAVIDKNIEINVKTKGSIDILDRKNSSIICMPKIQNISGEIMKAELTGTDAHLFQSWLDDAGNVIIKAKDNTAYITNYPYSVKIVYTLESGGRTYKVTTKPFTIKVKQGKVNLQSSLSSTQLYQAADNALNLNVTALNISGDSLAVKNISIAETKANKGMFDVYYNETAQTYQLIVKDAAKAKKGKTYSVKLNVKFSNQADNEKAKTTTVKVTIK